MPDDEIKVTEEHIESVRRELRTTREIATMVAEAQAVRRKAKGLPAATSCTRGLG